MIVVCLQVVVCVCVFRITLVFLHYSVLCIDRVYYSDVVWKITDETFQNCIDIYPL